MKSVLPKSGNKQALIDILRRRVDALEISPLPDVLTPKDAAQLLRISLSQLYSLDADGLLPEPALLGGEKPRRVLRWTKVDVLLWLHAGAPPRARWRSERRAYMRQFGESLAASIQLLRPGRNKLIDKVSVPKEEPSDLNDLELSSDYRKT